MLEPESGELPKSEGNRGLSQFLFRFYSLTTQYTKYTKYTIL